MARDRHNKKYDGVNSVSGILFLPSWWQTNQKSCTVYVHIKNWQHKHGQYTQAASLNDRSQAKNVECVLSIPFR
jgi:hypothetical protein